MHMSTKVNLETKDQIIIKCDFCDYKCKLNIQLRKHMKQDHINHPEHNCKEFIKEEIHLMRKEFKEAFETFADLIGEVISPFKNKTEEDIETLADTVYKLGQKIGWNPEQN